MVDAVAFADFFSRQEYENSLVIVILWLSIHFQRERKATVYGKKEKPINKWIDRYIKIIQKTVEQEVLIVSLLGSIVTSRSI